MSTLFNCSHLWKVLLFYFERNKTTVNLNRTLFEVQMLFLTLAGSNGLVSSDKPIRENDQSFDRFTCYYARSLKNRYLIWSWFNMVQKYSVNVDLFEPWLPIFGFNV